MVRFRVAWPFSVLQLMPNASFKRQKATLWGKGDREGLHVAQAGQRSPQTYSFAPHPPHLAQGSCRWGTNTWAGGWLKPHGGSAGEPPPHKLWTPREEKAVAQRGNPSSPSLRASPKAHRPPLSRMFHVGKGGGGQRLPSSFQLAVPRRCPHDPEAGKPDVPTVEGCDCAVPLPPGASGSSSMRPG